MHLVGAERQKHQGSHLSLAPIFAAALLLPPALTALAIVIAFVPETVRPRPRWYIAVFNVANFAGPALLARACFDAVGGTGDTAWALAASAGIAAFVVYQYAVLAVMLRLARRVRVLDTVRVDCVLIDAGLISLGAIAAALWEINEGLVALTLLPLALAYRSLAIPGLVEATRIEPKTGLLQHAPLPERPLAGAPARGAVRPAARRDHDRRRPPARDQHDARPPGGRQGRLKADDLDLATRILAVCDVYDALVSPRVYRDAWPVEKALAHLQSEAETSFDARCVTALILVLVGKPSEQSNGAVQGLGSLGARLAFPT